MLGQVLSFGLNIGAKLGVSSSALWYAGLMVGLKLLDLFIDWRNQDAKTKKAYIDLVTECQNKGLVSVKMKKQAQDQIDALNKLDSIKEDTNASSTNSEK